MACYNNCSTSCTCKSAECKRAEMNTKSEFLKFVNTYKDLKDLKECSDITLRDGQIIYVSTTKEYVAYDANTGGFKKLSISFGADIVLP